MEPITEVAAALKEYRRQVAFQLSMQERADAKYEAATKKRQEKIAELSVIIVQLERKSA